MNFWSVKLQNTKPIVSANITPEVYLLVLVVDNALPIILSGQTVSSYDIIVDVFGDKHASYFSVFQIVSEFH